MRALGEITSKGEGMKYILTIISIMIFGSPVSVYGGSVTYSWEANSSLDGVSGKLNLDISDLFSIESWSATSNVVYLTSFDFIGTSQPSESVSGVFNVPPSLQGNGDFLSVSGWWNIDGLTSIMFQGVRNDLVDTGGIKIAQGTWRLSSYKLDSPSPIPLPSSIILFVSGLFFLPLIKRISLFRKENIRLLT